MVRIQMTNQLPVLKGTDYNEWARDFTDLAKVEGVWGLFTGAEGIVLKPTLDTFLKPTDGSPTPNTMPTLTVAIAKYHVALDNFNKNEQAVRKAMSLLGHSVRRCIRRKIAHYNDPCAAWRFLQQMYRGDLNKAIEKSRTRLSEIRFNDYSCVDEFMDAILAHRWLVGEKNEKFTDREVILTALCGLMTCVPYQDFVQKEQAGIKGEAAMEGQLAGFTARLASTANEVSARRRVQTVERRAQETAQRICPAAMEMLMGDQSARASEGPNAKESTQAKEEAQTGESSKAKADSKAKTTSKGKESSNSGTKPSGSGKS